VTPSKKSLSLDQQTGDPELVTERGMSDIATSSKQLNGDHMAVRKAKKEKTALAKASKDRRQIEATLSLSPVLSAAALIEKNGTVNCTPPDETGDPIRTVMRMSLALREKVADVKRGDMSGMEEMLVAQSHALDALFHNLASSAQEQPSMKNLEGKMKLALRAQSQCRATIETLSAVKNPRQAVALVRQANIASVQQVNNGPPQESAPAEEK
jgi:hypothetical protein